MNYLKINQYPPNPYYWLCQSVGWLGFYSIQVLFVFSFAKITWNIALFYLAVSGVGLAITHIFRHFLIVQGWLKLNIPRLIIRVVPTVIILSFIWFAIDEVLNYLIFQLERNGEEKNKISYWAILLAILFNTSVILLVWTLLYVTHHFFKTYKQAEIEKWKLEAVVKEAELLALKSQINPHFIFNSLNNIRSLVLEDAHRARQMITHLSDLLRYSIQFASLERVSLAQEIEVVQDYLQLESIQFEERLRYRLEIAPEAQAVLIPPMVIQILVENAIKHGIAHQPQGGEITIKAQVIDNQLDVEVINTGQLAEKAERKGSIGLKNASQRLQLLSNSWSHIKISNLETGLVSARFSIPI
ncbi:MAG: histidine kinase [Microscillaceae bacterium]|jgi:two-component sensor histidine kinase|nr:histidine kinase [Microscillaceae bacterium]